MPIVVDANNLLYRLPASLRRPAELRRLSLNLARTQRLRLTLVWDGPPPPGVPERESLGQLTVVHAGSMTADDAIVRTLPQGAAAKQWTVVTDDRGLRARVRARGASVTSLKDWIQRLLDATSGERKGEASPSELKRWEELFTRSGKPRKS